MTQLSISDFFECSIAQASELFFLPRSIPGPIIPTPHRLPPLGFDGDVQQTESALDENLPTIVKRRLKKHRVAVP